MSDDFDFIIHSYTVSQAIEDKVLYPLIQEHWETLTGGLPIVVTAALHERFEESTLISIYDDWVHWYHHIRPTLAEEDQMFTTTVEGVDVWVIFDGTAVTLLRPGDY